MNKRLRIVALAFDGVNILDITGPLQAFQVCETRRNEATLYETILASARGGEVMTSVGVSVMTRSLADLASTSIDTIMVGGGGTVDGPIVPSELVHWIRSRAPEARRICSVCAGAFVLAEAGLLEHRRATTHWRWTELLQRRFPATLVDPDAIFVNDGKVWTSAGITAGIDLTLALIERDYGHAVAINAARRLVVFMKRPGGQSQFSVPLSLQSRKEERFAELHVWMRQNLSTDLRIERLAERAAMSVRSFSRVYPARVGCTPAKAVEAMRVEAACNFLSSSRLPLKQIAALVGLGDEQNLRRTFHRRFKFSPNDYRERFGSTRTDDRTATDITTMEPHLVTAAGRPTSLQASWLQQLAENDR